MLKFLLRHIRLLNGIPHNFVMAYFRCLCTDSCFGNHLYVFVRLPAYFFAYAGIAVAVYFLYIYPVYFIEAIAGFSQYIYAFYRQTVVAGRVGEGGHARGLINKGGFGIIFFQG